MHYTYNKDTYTYTVNDTLLIPATTLNEYLTQYRVTKEQALSEIYSIASNCREPYHILGILPE